MASNAQAQASTTFPSSNLRILVSSVASGLIFFFTAIQLIQFAPWGDEAEKKLTSFWQTIVTPQQLSTTLYFSRYLLIASFIVLAFFLIKLYMSLTVFDTLKSYHDTYIKPIARFFQLTEWLLRLLIFIYLLAGISGYNGVVKTLHSILHRIDISIPHPLPGADDFYNIAAYLCGLLFICLLWDLTLILALSLSKASDIPKRLWTNYFFPHATGLIVWIFFAITFSSQSHPQTSMIFFPIFSAVSLLALCWLTFKRVFGHGLLVREFIQALRGI